VLTVPVPVPDATLPSVPSVPPPPPPTTQPSGSGVCVLGLVCL
jgi:hypothetical protein